MQSLSPQLLALDFDGVLCNGLVEYFQTTWHAYCQLESRQGEPPSKLASPFYRTRPVIETGWEMPVLLHALLQGIPEGDILQDWPDISQRMMQQTNWSVPDLTAAVDGYRDRWIASDLNGWLACHTFYPGVIDRLRLWVTCELPLAIVTTKEERFARQLLRQEGIELPEGRVFGKAVKRPKHETLRLLGATSGTEIWFVEDRLKTLKSVNQQPDLLSVKLFLADWGYNVPADRHAARQNNRIHLLSLKRFVGDFEEWLQ